MTLELTDDEAKMVVDGVRNLNVNVPIGTLVDSKHIDIPKQVTDLLAKFEKGQPI
jgi:hypothetical protein